MSFFSMFSSKKSDSPPSVDSMPTTSVPSPTPSGPSMPGGNANATAPQGPSREELEVQMQALRKEKGGDYGMPLAALDKTNHKYKNAKSCPTASETPTAERTATKGMKDLVENNPSVTGTSWSDHREVQRADQAYHRSVTSQPDNPYGPMTTLATDYAPLGLRTAYSYVSSRIPNFGSRETPPPSNPGGDE